MYNWTLEVENFGIVKKACIEVSPFMMFVGDNNSGKSCILSLINGISKIDVFNEKFKIDKESDSFKLFAECIYNKRYLIDNKKYNNMLINILIDILNGFLNYNKLEIIKDIFNYNINIGKLNVKLKFNSKIKNKFEKIFILLLLTNKDTCIDKLIRSILSRIIKSVLFSDIKFISLKDNLLDFYTELRPSKNKYNKIIEFIEYNLIHGKIDMDNTTKILNYVSSNTENVKIPVNQCSSVVRNISPLIFMLKYSFIPSMGFVIEEPEASLHLKLQWQLARVFIKLVNKGIPIFITTQSDTIFQHINNMIKLSKNPDKKNLMRKFNYKKSDLINTDKIRIYQFDIISGKTEVTKLECEEYGFTVPIYNKVLFSMLEQVNSFQVEN